MENINKQKEGIIIIEIKKRYMKIGFEKQI